MLGLKEDQFARDLAATYPRLSDVATRIESIRSQSSFGAWSEQVDEGVADHRSMAAKRVHQIRRALAVSSDRPLSWAELARQFLILGEDEKARRAMHAALKLAPSNVYLTRCAVRLLTHLDEHGAAAHLLQRDGGAMHNPWLMAADVAIASSMGKTSRNMKKALDILARDRTNGHQLSELASAVGTVELNRGSRKHGKELIRKSLVSPTENALAQAQWCVSRGESLAIPDAAWNVPSSHEAKAFAAYSAVEFSMMIDACVSWFAEEPFSSRPGTLASTACFIPHLREKSLAMATEALRYAPESSRLLNNRAVCFAYSDQPQAALMDIDSAIRAPDFSDYGVVLATLGLTCYRSGESTLGHDCYDKSIAHFKKIGDVESALRASVHFALEEARYNRAAGEKIFSDVRDRCSRVDRKRFPELQAIVQIADQVLVHETALQSSGDAKLHALSDMSAPAKEQLLSIETGLLERMIPKGMALTSSTIIGAGKSITLASSGDAGERLPTLSSNLK
jgi:Tfp pilus assembly protein PilF